MIRVSRFNGTSFVINCEWIETIESTLILSSHSLTEEVCGKRKC